MIGCKVMRTLASVEFEIILILGFPCCLSSSSVRCLENVGEIITGSDADGAQSPRVPVPFPKDPYEAIRQVYLVETKTPESPHTVAPPTSLSDSTLPTSLPDSSPPTLVPFLRRTAHMAVQVPPAMSPGLSASIAEVAAMSYSVFRKRFRSSYESSPSSSPPDLPSRKRYRGTSELVEDDEEEDDEEEVEESLDSDRESEDAEDEGPTA
uniref:Uncharacterized protein n=1 Tax=Tanacetum cinerariifolium TaxID=118510 RepID=A0A6L2LSZ6_TANCI|nr:hypothetical protein [Tanacetum cinerariifolium]